MSTYLKTLRRIPDDIVLSMATREIDVGDGRSCICGWAMRESLTAATRIDADTIGVDILNIESDCAKQFGGTEAEWGRVFWDIAREDRGALVERAFVTRVMEAAGVA